jgi:xanthine dehydrogenase small subunit
MAAVEFLLNGKARRVDDVPPATTVLDWLRGHARLTGTKEGCAEGDCGACTIVIGREIGGTLRYQAVNSCLMMLPQIAHCAVLTVEGLAEPNGALHPVQQAMIDTDATQCGFCTPGFVMAMFAFHQGGEPAEDSIIHEALAGNLCRCTGYRSIVEACRRAARTPRVDTENDHEADTLAALPVCSDYRAGGQVFLRPGSLDAMFAAMANFPDALLLGGGTDLGLRVSKDREAIAVVISLATVAGLQRINVAPDAIEIGGGVTYTQALPHIDRHFPSFGALLRRIGSRQIRNLGTIAGNLVTASPIGDTIPCLIALDASVTLASRHGERVMPIESFIIGYRKTALRPGEVIAAVRIPFLAQDANFSTYKLSKRFDQDISTVIAAFHLERRNGEVHRLRAAYGGMAERVMRAKNVETALTGSPWNSDTLASIEVALARDFNPMTDHRGGAAYRLRAAANLLRRFAWETSSELPMRVEAL